MVLLVLIWGPTEGTRRPLPAVLLTALLVAGFEVLRRRITAEFPDAVRGERGPLVPRARAALARARTATAPAPQPQPVPAPAGVATASATDDAAMGQLERLAQMHRAGDLDDEEFSLAKQLVLTKT